MTTFSPALAALRRALTDAQERCGLLSEVATVDAAAVNVVSSFNPRIKYSLYSAYRIITAHERRHLWQAERVVEALGPAVAAT